MESTDFDKPATKKEVLEIVEIAVAQIVHAVNRALENHPTKEELQTLEKKVNQIQHNVTEIQINISHLQSDVSDLQSDVSRLQCDVTDIKRRVIDLEVDTPTQHEFEELKKKVNL